MNIWGWIVLFIAVLIGIFGIVTGAMNIHTYFETRQHAKIKKQPGRTSILFIVGTILVAIILTPIAFIIGSASTQRFPGTIVQTTVTSSSPSNMTPTNGSTQSTTPVALTATATARAQGIYEAESSANDIIKPAYIEKCPKCSNGHMVASVGRNYITNPPSEGSLQFNNVYAPHSGTYSVTISYCLSTTVQGNILVNNSTLVPVTYASAGNECWQDDAAGPRDVIVSIPLQQGENTLKFTSTQSPGTMGTIPSIDCIKIHY